MRLWRFLQLNLQNVQRLDLQFYLYLFFYSFMLQWFLHGGKAVMISYTFWTELSSLIIVAQFLALDERNFVSH